MDGEDGDAHMDVQLSEEDQLTEPCGMSAENSLELSPRKDTSIK